MINVTLLFSFSLDVEQIHSFSSKLASFHEVLHLPFFVFFLHASFVFWCPLGVTWLPLCVALCIDELAPHKNQLNI